MHNKGAVDMLTGSPLAFDARIDEILQHGTNLAKFFPFVSDMLKRAGS